MKYQIIKDPLPFLLVDEVFTPEEEKLLFQEIEFLYPNLKGPELTGAAIKDESLQKDNKGVFLQNVYTDLSYSSLFKLSHQVLNEETYKKLVECHPSYRSIRNITQINHLLSYYDDNSYYSSHWDCFAFTVLLWLHKHPKQFTGGDLIFDDRNVRVPIKHNAGVIFLSGYKHQVTKVTMNSQEPMAGRFCLSLFCTH